LFDTTRATTQKGSYCSSCEWKHGVLTHDCKKRPSTVTQNCERDCDLKNQQNSKLFEPNICTRKVGAVTRRALGC
jgi:hypothetical protein